MWGLTITCDNGSQGDLLLINIVIINNNSYKSNVTDTGNNLLSLDQPPSRHGTRLTDTVLC